MFKINKMSNVPDVILFMMTIGNVHGRETLNKLLDYNIPIKDIIVEHKSKLAENTKNYLHSEVYTPKAFDEIIRNTGIKVHYVKNLNDDDCLDIIKKLNASTDSLIYQANTPFMLDSINKGIKNVMVIVSTVESSTPSCLI